MEGEGREGVIQQNNVLEEHRKRIRREGQLTKG